MTNGDASLEEESKPKDVEQTLERKKVTLRVPRPANAVLPLDAPPADWEKAKPDHNHYTKEEPKSRM